jgi:hypothetical protein
LTILVILRIPTESASEQVVKVELTLVDLRSRPLVPIHGSSRVSDVQVWINDDLVDGLANSRTLGINTPQVSGNGLTRQMRLLKGD